MLTDDDVLTRLRGSFAASVTDVLPDPALLTRVRHAHHTSVRRKRLLAPAGIALVGLAATGAYATWPTSAGQPADVLAASPTPSASPAEVPGPTVKLFDYTFTLPSGFVVSYVKHVDLAKEQPPQPVHGQTAFFEATRGERHLLVTVYRGPIAAAQATVEPPEPSTLQVGTIAGFPAKTYAYAAGGQHCLVRGSDRSLGNDRHVGPCGQERSETRVTTAPQELVMVMTEDVSLTFVQAMLESGL